MTRYSYPTPDDLPPATGFAPFGKPEVSQIANYCSMLANFLTRMITSVRSAMDGKTNNVTDVTLNANATSTTLTDTRITPNSYLGFGPTTASAAAEKDNLYYTPADGSATLTHSNTADTDKTFIVCIIG